jgi:competence protein ComEA
VGVARLATSAVVVLAVLAAAYWLVKPPPVTTESRLPLAARAASTVPGPVASPTTTTVGGAAASAATGAKLMVHVAGAVAHSGVYRLPLGARVIDALEAAGGAAANADEDAVNLAAVLADGQRVYVPRVGESPPPGVEPSPVPSTVALPIDVNTATADQLDQLPGVGPATAAAIVAYRQLHGPFGAVDDLADVRGIGSAKLEALRGLVRV